MCPVNRKYIVSWKCQQCYVLYVYIMYDKEVLHTWVVYPVVCT
jgi:hypothetical protein